MGLFHHNDDREAKKEQEAHEQAEQRRQFALSLDGVVSASLERLTHWAYPGSEIMRFDDDTVGLQWQLRHTSADGGKFIDIVVWIDYDNKKPYRFAARRHLNVQEVGGNAPAYGYINQFTGEYVDILVRYVATAPREGRYVNDLS